jgi:Flp pilus assembly protein TadD
LASSTPDGREAMAEGVRLFRAGEFAEARARLEQARKAGLDSRSLYYNLGVVCYQLRDYPTAERWFLRLADPRSWLQALFGG